LFSLDVKARVLLSLLMLLTACAISQQVAAPGIQRAEQRVLDMGASSGSPSQDRLLGGALRGDQSAAHRFFSLAPDVDGEVALGYQTRIWMFLFEPGDVEFATAVERESPIVRAAVARFIHQLPQSYPSLSYPRTQRAVMQPTNV
jgi:hypothetical protein